MPNVPYSVIASRNVLLPALRRKLGQALLMAIRGQFANGLIEIKLGENRYWCSSQVAPA